MVNNSASTKNHRKKTSKWQYAGGSVLLHTAQKKANKMDFLRRLVPERNSSQVNNGTAENGGMPNQGSSGTVSKLLEQLLD